MLPDLDAGCSLADSINVQQLKDWKKKNPNAVVVSYVNTTADIKAESDYCCTSSNALQIVKSIDDKKEILFLPDMFLGAYVQKKTNKKIKIWPGECHVHAAMKFEEIKNLRDEYPDSEVLIHPECACGSQAMLMAEMMKSFQQQPQGQPPAGANPNDPTGSGGGTIGTGMAPGPQEQGFTGNAQPQGPAQPPQTPMQ